MVYFVAEEPINILLVCFSHVLFIGVKSFINNFNVFYIGIMLNKKFSLLSLIFIFLLFLISFSFAISPNGNIRIFAVTEDERGMAADLYAFVIPGSGEIAFFTSHSLVGKDTQTTGNIALDIAQTKTKISLGNNNLIYDIRANASEVDGPSAGAAMGLLVYSLLSEQKLNPAVGITGTINTDGSIGAVGGIGPKAQIASEIGIKLFMIPTGQSVTYIKDKTGKNKSVNLLDYGPKELGIKIVEVSTIDDVIKYAYTNIDEINIDVTQTSSTFIPNSISYKPILIPMSKISQDYIDRAKDAIDRAEKELEITDLDEIIRMSFYAQLGEAKRNVELSQIYLDQNYLYSAANYSFNAHVVAGTIELIATSPSLLLTNSKILSLKINDLKSEINSLKEEMNFIPLDKFEWLIGSQQRIAYAENALANIDENVSFANEDEERIIQISKIREFISAEQWFIVAIDFFKEAKKSDQLRYVNYSSEFSLSTNAKIEAVEKILNDANITDVTKAEALRRLDSAKISFKNEFYYAAMYDAYFAQAFLNSEIKRLTLTQQEIEQIVIDLRNNSKFESLWSNVFFDHGVFYIENSKFEDELGRANVKTTMLNTSHDLLTLSSKIEDIYNIVKNDIIKSKLKVYNVINVSKDNGIDAGLTYARNDSVEIYLGILAILLLLLLIMLIIVGFKSSRSKTFSNFSRADKIETLLNRLDKALSVKKINEAEYFFLKKKYEDEYNFVKDARAQRSKITLNLDESKAKLLALQKGLKDLKKHYSAGLIIPEDYERHLREVNEEMVEVKENIYSYELELHKARLNRRTENKNLKKEFSYNGGLNKFAFKKNDSNKKIFKKDDSREIINKKQNLKKYLNKLKDSEFNVKGTEELAVDEEKDELQESVERKSLLKKFKERFNKK
jgi:uncharacterized protein